MMKEITDKDIGAFIDHELNTADERALIKMLEQSPELRRVYYAIYRQKLLVQKWFHETQRIS